MVREFKYKGYKIRPQRFVEGAYRFAQIFDPAGKYWDETDECYRTTVEAINAAQGMIRHHLRLMDS